MVGSVGAGVVLVRVQARVPDRPDRAPPQVPEVHDQVWRDAPDLRIDLLRPEDLGPERFPVRPGSGLELLGQLLPNLLVALGLDDAVRFPTLHVEEEPAVVPAVAPRDR